MNEDIDSENVHRRYVNAERGDEGIPDHFKEQLNHNPQHDLLQEPVFRELWYSDRPIHSKGSLESTFDETRQTIGKRLDEMVERGLLKKGSINNGDYWWINFPESNDPLPNDAIVHPKPDREEMTVEEFFSQTHILIGAIALFATAIGGVMVLFGALSLEGENLLPIPAETILVTGLWTLIVSYICLMTALVLWVIEKSVGVKSADIQAVFSNR